MIRDNKKKKKTHPSNEQSNELTSPTKPTYTQQQKDPKMAKRMQSKSLQEIAFLL